MAFTNDDVSGLAAKLEALQLSEGERNLLDSLLGSALGDSEVEGFAPRAFEAWPSSVMTHPYFGSFKNSDGILYNVHGLPKVNRE